jgi:YidC/Oxa1 family membrane protein insertase
MAGPPGRRRRAGLGRPALPLLGLLVFVGPIVPSVWADEAGGNRVHVTTNRLDLQFSLDGARPVTWRACHPSCAQADAAAGTSVRFTRNDDPPQTRLVLRGPGLAVDLQGLRFTADVSEDTRARIVTFSSDLPVDGVRLVKSFAVAREGYEIVMTARLLGPNAAAFMAGRRLDLGVEAGPGLFPAPAVGFAAMLERVSLVVVGEGGVRVVSNDRRDSVPLRAGEWTGFRSRFWAILLRSDGAGALEPRSTTSVAVVPADEPGSLSWRYTLYSGPLEKGALTHADPALEQMLFSGLWSWLRPLSFALLFLLRALTAVVGHPGVAIIVLALSVKILLLPLTAVADHLQTQVNTVQTRLQPGIDAINAAHKGEERARRTLALYRAEGVHPLYTLKSLLGFLIQLPVFIAVFDMLAEDFDLNRVSFLWIQDLSRPDELLRLPGCLPFFGCHLNLLPFLMSGVSLVTLLRFRSPVLTPPLVRRQRRNLMTMTLLFFLFFYTFPAGMVLYWTSTNFVQLVGQELKRQLRPDRRKVPS